jgi:NADP-dependent 3-hydroxy acid dehydrogenase YdfG
MKNIIITGAGSGIGEATARLLAAAGHRLILAGRTAEAIETLKEELGANAHSMPCDVRDYGQVAQLSAYAMATLGSIDVVVNNAGVGFFETLENGSIEHWHQMVDVNVKGLLNTLHAFLPHLISSSGHLINLASVGAHQVFPNSGVYCATKHAVLAISESMRVELPDKVRVTTISPGSVNTPFIERTTNEEMLMNYRDYFATGLPAQLVAEQIKHAIDCPPGAVVSEIIVRPSRTTK